MIFLLILLAIPLLTGVWLMWVRRRLGVHRPARWVRRAVSVAVVLLMAGLCWLMAHRRGIVAADIPTWLHASLLLWSLLFLPLLAVPGMVASVIAAGIRKMAARRTEMAPPSPPAPPADGLSRREWLRTATLALPMLATFGTVAVSVPQRAHFRVRRMAVPVPDLPPALAGLTLTHLSDTHAGKFTQEETLRRLADAINHLGSDLVLLTGDLIDHSLEHLPAALDMLAALQPRLGVFAVEGNHDLFDDAREFRAALPARGIPLLLDQSALVRAKGHPLEIMGVSWAARDADLAARVDYLLARRDPDAFPLLLAHHPHAFDPAAARGVPLTLAGHTHGGQLMVKIGRAHV